MLNIAFATIRELTRNKILYMILVFAVVFILFTLWLRTLSLGEVNKMVLDFGLWMIEFFWLVSVLFIGSQLLFREIDGKNIYLIISKPISRYEFILGKFLWFAAVLFSIVTFQSIVFFIAMYLSKSEFSIWIVYSIIFIYLKLLILFAIILFLSTFMSSVLLIIMSVIIFSISHSISFIIDLAHKTWNIVIYYISNVLYVIFPPFEALNIKNLIWNSELLNPTLFVSNFVYSILYLSIILFFTVLIFNRKNFEN